MAEITACFDSTAPYFFSHWRRWHQRTRWTKEDQNDTENKGAPKSGMRVLWFSSQMTSRAHCMLGIILLVLLGLMQEEGGKNVKLMQMQLSTICILLMIRQMADVTRPAPSWEMRQLAGSGSHFVSDAARCTHSMALETGLYCMPVWHGVVPL